MTRRLTLLILLVLGVGCTTYKQYDPNTGLLTHDFSTSGNLGISTSKVSESNSSSTDGIPLLGGSFANDMLTEARPTSDPSAPPTVRVGDMELVGTLDHSTMVDTAGHWTWRAIRSIVTGKVFLEGIGAWEADKLAGHRVNETKIVTAGATEQLTQQELTKRLASDNATSLGIAELNQAP